MSFIADLHIHSRFSRATSKALTPAHLAVWARIKGIDVLGCGDFTHPAWRAELREQLVMDEASGLYALKDARLDHTLPDGLTLPCPAAASPGTAGPLFCMQAEISSIYKKHGKVRKVHNLVYVPTLDDADALSRKLAAIGNLNSDGRPILGLDSRDLLEIVLETCPQAVLVPAHVWTPWFALFGSKSGFDRLEDCFGDLSPHIFALETGLSSDPPMNRMVSALDRYALISNSDAHSGANLGREANLFDGAPSYAGMFAALRATARREGETAGDCRFLGTLEFYPEEGKYHLDGHRDCHVVMEPQEAREHGNICPVCGKPLTIGVLHRVLELADRTSPAQLEHEPQQRSLIPLPEVIGELLACGPATRKAQARYAQTLAQLGPELDILCHMPIEQIRAHWPELGIAVERLRTGQVYRQGGYDGEYGVVRVFAPDEQRQMHGKASLFAMPSVARQADGQGHAPLLLCAEKAKAPNDTPLSQTCQISPASADFAATTFSPEQQAAMTAGPAPVLVLAGPGSGKTRMLVGRIRHLLANGVEAQRILALTFTRRAAGEIRQRLGSDAQSSSSLVHCDTLHGLAFDLLRERDPNIHLLDEQMSYVLFARANSLLPAQQCKRLWDALALARERMELPPPDSPLAEASANYTRAKGQMNALDYTGLLEALLACAPSFGERFSHVLVDEVQDLSALQLALLRTLLPPSGAGFFAIGDPDQSIYGFRGALGIDEARLSEIWPDLQIHRLNASYRSCQPVLDMAQALFAGKAHCGTLRSRVQQPAELHIHTTPDAQAEARWVAQRVQRLLGMTSHTLLDHAAKRDATALDGQLAPGDIGVLVRLKAQIGPLAKALELAGIPCAVPSAGEFWQDEFCHAFLQTLAQTASTADAIAGPDFLASAPQQLAEQFMANGVLCVAGANLELNAQWKKLCRLHADCGSWPAFFERLALLREEECVQAKAQRVQVLTLHASKGLEFDAVFLPGLEQGLMPLDREWLFGTPDGPDEGGIDEEKRLLYVGVTRAARAIFASHCTSRTVYGRSLAPAPSPFLALISQFCRQTATRRHSHTTSEQLKLL